MNKVIRPFKYDGSININSSKSIFQRALAISCFSESEFIVVGDYCNQDSITAIEICKKIGLDITYNENGLKVSGNILNNKKTIKVNSRESGLSTRIFSVLLSSFFEETEICLEATAEDRVFDFSALADLGVKVDLEKKSILMRR